MPYELWKCYKPNLKYLRVLEYVAKILFPKSKKRKIGSKIFDCIFIRYAEYTAACGFLVLKSDVLNYNIII